MARNDSTKIANRINWVNEWSKTDLSFLENCIFIDESGFNIKMRPPGGWSLTGTPEIVETPAQKLYRIQFWERYQPSTL